MGCVYVHFQGLPFSSNIVKYTHIWYFRQRQMMRLLPYLEEHPNNNPTRDAIPTRDLLGEEEQTLESIVCIGGILQIVDEFKTSSSLTGNFNWCSLMFLVGLRKVH